MSEKTNRDPELRPILEEPEQEKKIDSKQIRQNELMRLFQEAEKTNDSKKKVALYVEFAKTQLERQLGVKDLSNIEAVRLRNMVEKLLPQYERETELMRQGKMKPELGFEMEEEAAFEWLYETYGIHINDIPYILFLEDSTGNREYKYEATQKKESDEKRQELEKQGHEVYGYRKIPADFKEYLRRLRDNAHGEEVKEIKD